MDLLRRVADWALAQPIEGLPREAVPGTTDGERIGLAAIGGIAAALAGERCDDWPEPIRDWALRAPAPPRDFVEGIRRELAGGPDVLAQLYERLVSGRNRRRLGTFFTPPAVVDFMLGRAEDLLGAPAVVIDPGAGVGAFSLAAGRRWPQAQVAAVDVNVVTLGLMAARSDGNISLVLEDYLSWALGGDVPEAHPRLWIGNPPYTRHQELTPAVKERAAEASQGLVKSGLAGLSAYFLAVTLRAMGPDDALCFLLPGSWTDARYGRPLRSALRDLARRPIEFYGFGSELDVFPGTRVTAMVTVVGPSRPTGDQTLTTSLARIEPSGVVTGRAVARDRLDGAIEGLGTWLWRRKRSVVKDSVPLGDVARVRRGVATGANDFFLLTDGDQLRYPPAATLPAVRRLRSITGHRLTPDAHARLGAIGERRWLLRLADPSLLSAPAVEAWLRAAEDAGVPAGYLASHRDPWYLVEAVEPPDVILSPMGKQRMRAVVNDVRAVPSNSLYGIYLADASVAAQVANWLNGANGQIALFEHARAYGAGLFKLEPKDVLAVRIPRQIAEVVEPSGEAPHPS